MQMTLEKLTIQLDKSYLEAGPDNKYYAELHVSYHKNSMKVRLGEDTCKRVLKLCGDEIASAAQVQISEFVATALSVSETPMIEGEATEKDNAA